MTFDPATVIPPSATSTDTLTDADDGVAVASHNKKKQAAVLQLLGSHVVCTLRDGRKARGTLVCVDRLGNLILADCSEDRVIHSRDYVRPGNSPTSEPPDRVIHSRDYVRPGNSPTSEPPVGNSNVGHERRIVTRKLQQAMIPGPELVQVQQVRGLGYERQQIGLSTPAANNQAILG